MMSKRLAKPVGIAIAGLAASGLAVGCAGTASTSGTPSASAKSPSPTMPVDGNVLPPVMVTPGQTDVAAKVGDTIVFSGHPVDVKIESSDSSVLKVRQGGRLGSFEENPSATALKAGVATVTIVDPKEGRALQSVRVTIKE